MYSIFVILSLVIFYYGRRLLPNSFEEWWENSAFNRWMYPIITFVITVGVALGIEYDILNWGAIVIPILLGAPYLWGMISGIWDNRKHAGRKVTCKDEVYAKEIVVKSLSELGCKPEINKEGIINVSYQGENFQLICKPRYVRIWDPFWAGIKIDDPDLPKIREAINEANFNFGPTVVMSDADDDREINIHSRFDIMLHPACPDNSVYLKATLDSFFDTKENVRKSFHQLKGQQETSQKNRRPVGFDTTSEL